VSLIIVVSVLQCETLIEEHEELLIETFQQTEDDVENYLCVTVLG